MILNLLVIVMLLIVLMIGLEKCVMECVGFGIFLLFMVLFIEVFFVFSFLRLSLVVKVFLVFVKMVI